MTKKTEKDFDLNKLYEEYLAGGGNVEVFEPGQRDSKVSVGSISKKSTELMTLEEGALLYTKKQTRPRKVKVPDFSKINIELIPEHLRHILEKNVTSEVIEIEEEYEEDEEEVEE